MKAAYNYQFVTKDPGAFAHNPAYAAQLLHDSIADLGTRVSVDLKKATQAVRARILNGEPATCSAVIISESG